MAGGTVRGDWTDADVLAVIREHWPASDFGAWRLQPKRFADACQMLEDHLPAACDTLTTTDARRLLEEVRAERYAALPRYDATKRPAARSLGHLRGDWTADELLPSYQASLKITRGLATKARLRGTFDKRYRADVPRLARMAGDLGDVIWWLTTGSAPWWWWRSEPGRLDVTGGIGGRRLA